MSNYKENDRPKGMANTRSNNLSARGAVPGPIPVRTENKKPKQHSPTSPIECAKTMVQLMKQLSKSNKQVKVVDRKLGTTQQLSMRAKVQFSQVSEYRVVLNEKQHAIELSFWLKLQQSSKPDDKPVTLQLQSCITQAQRGIRRLVGGVDPENPLTQHQLLQKLDEAEDSFDANLNVDNTAAEFARQVFIRDPLPSRNWIDSGSSDDEGVVDSSFSFGTPVKEPSIPIEDAFNSQDLLCSGTLHIADFEVAVIQPTPHAIQYVPSLNGLCCLFDAYHHACIGALYATQRNKSYATTQGSQPPTLTSGRPTRRLLEIIQTQSKSDDTLWDVLIAATLYLYNEQEAKTEQIRNVKSEQQQDAHNTADVMQHAKKGKSLCLELGAETISLSTMKQLVEAYFEPELISHVSVFGSVEELHYHAKEVSLFPHTFLFRAPINDDRAAWHSITMLPDTQSGDRRVALVASTTKMPTDYQTVVNRSQHMSSSEEERYRALYHVAKLSLGYHFKSSVCSQPKPVVAPEYHQPNQSVFQEYLAEPMQQLSDVTCAINLKESFAMLSSTKLNCCSGAFQLPSESNSPTLVLFGVNGESTILRFPIPFTSHDATMKTSTNSFSVSNRRRNSSDNRIEPPEFTHVSSSLTKDGITHADDMRFEYSRTKHTGNQTSKPARTLFSPLSPTRKSMELDKPSIAPSLSLDESIDMGDMDSRQSSDKQWMSHGLQRPNTSSPATTGFYTSPTLSPAHRRSSSELPKPHNLFLDSNNYKSLVSVASTIDIGCAGVLQQIKSMLFPNNQWGLNATLCGIHTARAGSLGGTSSSCGSVQSSPIGTSRHFFDQHEISPNQGRNPVSASTSSTPVPRVDDEMFVRIGDHVTNNPLEQEWLQSPESHDTIGILVVYLPSLFVGGDVIIPQTKQRLAVDGIIRGNEESNSSRELIWFSFRTRQSQSPMMEMNRFPETQSLVSGQYFRLVYLLHDQARNPQTEQTKYYEGKRVRGSQHIARNLSLPILHPLQTCLANPEFMRHGGFIAIPFTHRLGHTSNAFLKDSSIEQLLRGVDAAIYACATQAGIHVTFMAAYQRGDDEDQHSSISRTGGVGLLHTRFDAPRTMNHNQSSGQEFEWKQHSELANEAVDHEYQHRYPLLIKRNFAIAPFHHMTGRHLHQAGCANSNSSQNTSRFDSMFTSSQSLLQRTISGGSGEISPRSLESEYRFWEEDQRAPFGGGIRKMAHLILWLGEPKYWEVAHVKVPHSGCCFGSPSQCSSESHWYAPQADGSVGGKRKQQLMSSDDSNNPHPVDPRTLYRRDSERLRQHGRQQSASLCTSGLESATGTSSQTSGGFTSSDPSQLSGASQSSEYRDIETNSTRSKFDTFNAPPLISESVRVSEDDQPKNIPGTRIVYSTAILLLHIPTPTQRQVATQFTKQ